MKRINEYFLVLTITLAVGLTACGSVAEKTAADKPSNGAAQSGAATGTKENTENKTAENKNANNAKQADLTKVYDGRTSMEDAKFAKATKTDEDLVRTEFKAKEAEIKQKFGDRYCDESDVPDITGTAKGSFTKADSKQTAFHYVMCSSGSSHFGVGGIMIFEGDKVVSHYVYGEEGVMGGGVFTLPDINKNGLTELVLMDSQMHQGNYGEYIEITEFKDGDLSDLGGTTVASDNSGAAEDDSKVGYEASEIMVRASENPMFYINTFERTGKSKEWKVGKKTETRSLEKNFGKNYKIS